MVTSMTNRLLAVVIAIALSSGIAAHAAQAPQRPIAPGLTSASDLPTALQTAASHITESATGAIDPAAAIKDAYQRDHVALEHLRQQASALKGSAHPAFEQYLNNQEATLAELEHSALATVRPSANTAIAGMDALVSAAQDKLAAELQSQAKSSDRNHQGNQGQSQASKQHGSDN